MWASFFITQFLKHPLHNFFIQLQSKSCNHGRQQEPGDEDRPSITSAGKCSLSVAVFGIIRSLPRLLSF